MLDVDAILSPWWDRLQADFGELELYDAHTHIGADDPDGMRQTSGELMASLERARARAVVFPMHEPAGYPLANDRVLEAAGESDGRLVAFCRVDPHAHALREAVRCLDAGARGIKLHPRAEQFTLSEPIVRDLIELAHDRRVPVLIHAGRGIPALGCDTVRLSGEFPDAHLILAHAAISDLAWLWRVLPDHPNVLIDTSWWNPVDLVALFALAPPSSIVWASDSPYGRPIAGIVMTLRCALQAGLSPEQVRGVAGGNLVRVIAGERPADLGPAPGQPDRAFDLLLERVVINLSGTFARLAAQADATETLVLARLACAVGTDGPHADVHAAVLDSLDRYEAELAPPPPGLRFPVAMRHLIQALVVARTPDVPLPPLPGAPEPTRAEAGA